jgi:hypothetical protein
MSWRWIPFPVVTLTPVAYFPEKYFVMMRTFEYPLMGLVAAWPVLRVIAEYDPFLPRDQWGLLRSGLGSGVTSTLTEDASHALVPEQPDGAAAVISYLQSGPGSAR